jgi:hypothetical protein
MFIKTVGLHALSHSEEENIFSDCDVCEFVVTSDNSPFSPNEQISFEQPIQHYYNKQVFYEYAFQFVEDQIESSLFSRPPPIV